jgi:hypothetical protein
MATIIVRYWKGTTQLEAKARTYAGAMRIADRNQNAYPATFWTPAGERLIDDGGHLVEEEELERGIATGSYTVYA